MMILHHNDQLQAQSSPMNQMRNSVKDIGWPSCSEPYDEEPWLHEAPGVDEHELCLYDRWRRICSISRISNHLNKL